MRKLLMAVAVAIGFGVSAESGTMAAPIAGYEGLYSALIAACTEPLGTVENCQAAIDAYASALGPEVDLVAVRQSFAEARLEILTANKTGNKFQMDIGSLFERLLPAQGVIGRAASPTIPG